MSSATFETGLTHQKRKHRNVKKEAKKTQFMVKIFGKV